MSEQVAKVLNLPEDAHLKSVSTFEADDAAKEKA
jgi:hypothetical protein